MTQQYDTSNNTNETMQAVSLNCHPKTPCEFVHRLDVEAERLAAGDLRLRFVIGGDLNHLRIPDIQISRRRNYLSQHTCCEAFLKARNQAGYYEFNFAPSTDWALYQFSGYRHGMTAIATDSPPAIIPQPSSEGFELEVLLDLSQLDLAEERLELGLSAVIETQDGKLSYWAVRHPAGRPDFHQPEVYALELPPVASQ
jgi:hypothetical protein